MDLVAGRAISVPMNQTYLAIISGLRRGLIASLARVLLSVLSVPYALVVKLRNILYDHGILRSHRAGVPTICVGNISCGGTGKTPMVIALVRMLQAAGRRPAILTRGYKGSDEIPADEVLIFAGALPDIPVIVGGDRVASAKRALRDHDLDILVMDDGFGHRRLARDLDIVLLVEPLDRVRLLPRALYREPPSSLARADIIIKTYDPLDDDSNYALRQPAGLLGLDGPLELSELQNRKVLAFCGIGNPASFEQTLANAGAKVLGKKHYPDHYDYRQVDLDELAEYVSRAACSLAVTTMKDWVKIQHHKLSWPEECDCQLCALDIEMTFDERTRHVLTRELAALFDD